MDESSNDKLTVPVAEAVVTLALDVADAPLLVAAPVLSSSSADVGFGDEVAPVPVGEAVPVPPAGGLAVVAGVSVFLVVVCSSYKVSCRLSSEFELCPPRPYLAGLPPRTHQRSQ